jgi:predicted transcriptional regulator
MACAEGAVVVLLPIKPRYADPIMDGRKRVEFRKTVFARTPSYVVVYASSPIGRVLGYFEVSGIDVDGVEALWAKYGRVGAIVEDEFTRYFRGRDAGVAIGVGRVVPSAAPMGLAELGLGRRPPQSFMYVDNEVISRLRADRRRAGRAGRIRLRGRGEWCSRVALEVG